MNFVNTNVAKDEDWEALMENTLSKWGRVDILVNNAGTSYKNKVTLSLKPAEMKTANIPPSQQPKSPKTNSTKSSP